MPSDLLFFFSLVFLIGLLGIVFRRTSFLMSMFSIEIMYLGIICFSISITIINGTGYGQTYALIILILAACESAVGLALLIVLYKFGNSLSFFAYEELQG